MTEPVTEIVLLDQRLLAQADRRRAAVRAFDEARWAAEGRRAEDKALAKRLALEQKQRRRRRLLCGLGAVVLLLGLGACVLAAVG